MNNIFHKITPKLSENFFLILSLLWVFAWVSPWTSWLNTLPWVRMVLTMLIFVVPGMTMSMILTGNRFTLPAHFSSGFALSVFLIGVLGLICRLFHLPFELIKFIFILIGLIDLLILNQYFHLNRPLYETRKLPIASIVLLICMIILGGIVVLQYRFGVDDFSYLAYLTTWQHSISLDFKEVFFGSGNIVQLRFLLSVFPMSLAFWAEISGLHGIWLLGLYLEPLLVVFALFAAYNLYRDFLSSEYEVIVALLLHFTFLCFRQNAFNFGTLFFNRLSHDKSFAAFILAPVFFWAIRHFFQTFTWRSGLFALLIGLSVTLTHPVILAFCIFVAGVYIFVLAVNQREYKRLVIIWSLLIVILLPQAFLRFVEIPWVSRYVLRQGKALLQPGSFDLESALDTNNIDSRISYIEGTPFYGFNLNVVKMQLGNKSPETPIEIFFSRSYLWILGIAFLWALFNLNKEPAAPFVFATSLLVILCAVPYTGWLVGRFVTARMILRSTWLLPIGLMGVILLRELSILILHAGSMIAQRMSGGRAVFNIALITCLILLGIFSRYHYETARTSLIQIKVYKNKLERLAGFGEYLENNFENPVIFAAPVGSYGLTNYLPGLSSKSKVIFFRSSSFSVFPIDLERIQLIFAPPDYASIRQRVSVLKKYDVEYILMEDPYLKKYYASYPDSFYVQEFDGFWIIKFFEG